MPLAILPVGADPDLLLNWWYGDNVWMQTRCPWKDPLSGRSSTVSWTRLLPPRATSSKKKWNECFDIIADNAVLYPVVHVKTVSASWDDPSTAPRRGPRWLQGHRHDEHVLQGRCDRQGVRLA